MGSVSLDKDKFFRRLKKLYAAWQNNGDQRFAKMDCLVNAVGMADNVIYNKSIALQTWLLGYELSNTIMLLASDAVYFLGSKKKIEFLSGAASFNDKNNIPIKLLLRHRKDNNKTNFNVLMKAIKASNTGKTLGVFSKDIYHGEFIDSWKAALGKEKFSTVEVSSAVAYLMAPKEDSELITIRKASIVALNVFKMYLIDQVMQIIDADKKVKHSKLAAGVALAINDKKYVAGVDVSQVDLCYPPIIQSGGKYSLKFSVTSDNNILHFGAIVCSLGVRYKFYCSNIVRTLLVKPSEAMQYNYEFLVTLEEEVLKKLTAGTKLADVYETGYKYVKKEKPNLIENLTKTFGFAMGIEFRESSLVIGEKISAVAEKGMVFNINIGFSNLQNPDATDTQSRVYALFIGDTVIVNDGEAATIVTNSKRKMKSISIFFKEESEVDDNDINVEQTPTPEILGRGKRTAIINSKLRAEQSAEEKRRKHQKELLLQLNEKARERLTKQSCKTNVKKISESIVSYRDVKQMPHVIKNLNLYVDGKYDTVILPVFGIPVPFHISMIKNISQSIEGDYMYLRINFFHPGSIVARTDGFPSLLPNATYVKELTYRSSNTTEPGAISPPSLSLVTNFRLIKELQRKFKNRLTEKRERKDLVKQDDLILSHDKAKLKLKDLLIRPSFTTKRTTGTLETHMNGFRCTFLSGEKIDLLYNNIKHAFFQTCDSEIIILLHFHLKNEIILGKRKHEDIQFYTEVGEIATDLYKHQHIREVDEIVAEQSDHKLREKLKKVFKSFCEKVENLTKQEIEFDTPFRELGFFGAPFRSTVFLQPTTDCLVNLTDWPPFVITLEEVELVYFERVLMHLKNFDMVFVFKDYHKKVAMVNAIPINALDNIKEWLNCCDIRYFEGIQSLNWLNIMKTVTADPEGFFESGGWTFLEIESDDEDQEDNDEEEDDAYEPSSSGSNEESDDESEYSGETEEYTTSEYSLDSDEESGKDWSDLERETAKVDGEQRNWKKDYSRNNKKVSKVYGNDGHTKNSDNPLFKQKLINSNHHHKENPSTSKRTRSTDEFSLPNKKPAFPKYEKSASSDKKRSRETDNESAKKKLRH